VVLILSLALAAAPTVQPPAAPRVNVRGNGVLTCATAFLPENRVATEHWVAGFWAAWDMAEIDRTSPVAPNSDFNGIVGEVEKVCQEQPSTDVVRAVLTARKAIKAR